MADTATHLVDHVLPRAPYRQWVVTVPKSLRLVLARDPAWASWAGNLAVRAIGAWQRRAARARGMRPRHARAVDRRDHVRAAVRWAGELERPFPHRRARWRVRHRRRRPAVRAAPGADQRPGARDLLAEDAKDGVSQIAFGDEANLDVRVTQMLEGLEKSLHPRKGKPIRVVFAGAGGTAVSAAAIILARPNTEVTMIGQGTPTGLIGNPQFRELATAHASSELADMLHIKPGDGRLKMYLEDKISFRVPEPRKDADGRQTFEAYPSRPDHPGEFVGDAYVVSSGRAKQTPPEISDLILQVTRSGGTVHYRVDFDSDRQFTGYTVMLTPKNGKTREMKITGAASRYVPIDTTQPDGDRDPDLDDLVRASGGPGTDSNDVPAASGGFPGGFAGSSVQGARHTARDNKCEVAEMRTKTEILADIRKAPEIDTLRSEYADAIEAKDPDYTISGAARLHAPSSGRC